MRIFTVFCLLVLSSGCSGDSGVAVSGKVAYSDGSPLSKGVINISNEKNSYRGKIQSDGTYSLRNVVEGKYKVAITGAKEGGDEAGEMNYDDDGNYVESGSSEPKPLIDEKYQDPSESGLTLTVPGEYDLQVEKP